MQLNKRPLFLAAMLTLVFCTASCSASPAMESETPAHHGDGNNGFVNPYIPPYKKNVFSFIKMRWFSDEPFADQTEEIDKIEYAESALESVPEPDSSLGVIWLGHSTFLLRSNGLTVLTDPILSDRASPLSFAGPKRLAELPYTLEQLPVIDIVIISHNHYDHLDKQTIKQLGNQPQYLVPLGLKDWFEAVGIEGERVHELDWWQQWSGRGIKITATPSQHWSGRGLFDRNESLWASWVLEWDSRRLWFGGDTGYNPVQFKQIGEKWTSFDLAMIPIGAYAPRWFMKASHVNPEESIQIHNDIGSRFSIGMHWSTFQLSAESLEEPKLRLNERVTAGALSRGQFITLPIGGYLSLE